MKQVKRPFLPWCLLTFIFCFIFTRTPAQQPAHFLLGENRFRGVQIYDVIQDGQKNFIIATNDGIWHYDYYQFRKIECPGAKSSSVFNFVRDPAGNIYCHNLNNQVFKITGLKCILLLELPPDESSADPSLAVAPGGELIIASRNITTLDATTGKKTGRRVLDKYLGQPFALKSKNVIFHLGHSDSALVVSAAGIETNALHFPAGYPTEDFVLKFYRKGGQDYAVDLKTKQVFLFDERNFSLEFRERQPAFERGPAVGIYQTGDNLWATSTQPGIIHLRHPQTDTSGRLYFSDYFISDVYEDHEGNLLFSTFDKGIIVVPDLNVPDVIHPFRDDPVTSLCTDSSMGLVLGTSRGKLLGYKSGKFTPLNMEGQHPVGVIVTTQHFDWVIFDDGVIRAYNKKTGVVVDLLKASLKDVVLLDESRFCLGTNRGIFTGEIASGGKTNINLLPGFNFRVYSLELNHADGSLYASTAAGLFRVPLQGPATKITHEGKDLFPTAIASEGGVLYASLRETGLLQISQGKTKKINISRSGQPPVVFRKLLAQGGVLLGHDGNGLYRITPEENKIENLGSNSGFHDNRILDFAVEGNDLWVSHSGGVQRLRPENSGGRAVMPSVQLSSLRVNDTETSLDGIGNFSSQQRKIHFVISCLTLRNRESIRYHYQLEGYDEKWTQANYDQNEITYQALAPGSYTLRVKAENQGVFSETVSYSFSIRAPFYYRAWFIGGCVLLFLLLVRLLYRRQLKRQEARAAQLNELNNSRLTAIRSQMNPHFIFNALNSIQDLVLKGDVQNSYTYITTFSNLVRSTLSYSEKDFIDFDQELQLLGLYLQLEQLRYKNELKYKITAPDTSGLRVPPLLIQPFVENALVHGLLHKEGEKRLDIRFELMENLVCVIEDNGVGREKAKAIRQRQRGEHESFSGGAIRKRFEILSGLYEGEFGFTYEDLGTAESPAGTRVTLVMPVKRSF